MGAEFLHVPPLLFGQIPKISVIVLVKQEFAYPKIKSSDRQHDLPRAETKAEAAQTCGTEHQSLPNITATGIVI